MIALDACARMEGLPSLLLWDLVIAVFDPLHKATPNPKPSVAERSFLEKQTFDMFGSIDFVPPSLPISHGEIMMLSSKCVSKSGALV